MANGCLAAALGIGKSFTAARLNVQVSDDEGLPSERERCNVTQTRLPAAKPC